MTHQQIVTNLDNITTGQSLNDTDTRRDHVLRDRLNQNGQRTLIRNCDKTSANQ